MTNRLYRGKDKNRRIPPLRLAGNQHNSGGICLVGHSISSNYPPGGSRC